MTTPSPDPPSAPGEAPTRDVRQPPRPGDAPACAGRSPERTGDLRLLATLLAALAAASVPGAYRAAHRVDPPRLTAAPARIDLRRASAADLTALPGVGPALAARIVAARDAGPLRGPDDLLRVHGVGPALAARIAPHVAFDPDPGH